jgi:hypothetical protein
MRMKTKELIFALVQKSEAKSAQAIEHKAVGGLKERKECATR